MDQFYAGIHPGIFKNRVSLKDFLKIPYVLLQNYTLLQCIRW